MTSAQIRASCCKQTSDVVQRESCPRASPPMLTYLYDGRVSLAARMGTGACTGYALLGSVETFCASVLDQDRTLIVTATIFTLTLALLVFRQIRCQVLTNICASADRLRKECRRHG